MSLEVELPRLLEVAAGFGTVPMLLTTDPDGRPRAAAIARIQWDGERARVAAGRKSFRNAGERPLVSLLWPAPAGARFALLVDGEVAGTETGGGSEPDGRPERGGTVLVRATSAILHAVRSGS